MDRSFLNWPFFEQKHRILSSELEQWCKDNLPVDHSNVDQASIDQICRDLVAKLGAGGWLRHSAIAERLNNDSN